MTSSDVIFDLSEKNDRSTFGRPPKLSNAVCRFSLRCLVFEISGGAVIRPPVGAKLAQPPSVRGLQIKNTSTSFEIRYEYKSVKFIPEHPVYVRYLTRTEMYQ